MKDRILSILDLETSGPSYHGDRIIEIGLIQIKDGKVLNEYNSLINPEIHVPEFILQMTGITQVNLDKAPTFRSLKGDLYEMLSNTIVVAHNVRFDYGFLKAEFKRHDLNFIEDTICTVQLSRKLFPGYRSHGLDALISRFGFECENRHRALDDAKVIKDFLELLPDYFSLDEIEKSLRDLKKSIVLPPKIDMTEVDKLPHSPGVYYFYGDSDYPLYIGKSNDLKKRVLSHFSSSNLSSREYKIFSQIQKIDYEETAGDLGALLLESEKVKELKPLHNKQLRRVRNLHVLMESVNQQGYKCIDLEKKEKIVVDDLEKVLAVFKKKDKIKDYLRENAKEYSLCLNLLEGYKKGDKECFYSQIGYCLGACCGAESVDEYNRRFEKAFKKRKLTYWPYEGPILISESYDDVSGDLFVFDNWCLIASGKYSDSFYELKLVEDVKFDRDVYLILKKYMKKRGAGAVQELAQSELESLLST